MLESDVMLLGLAMLMVNRAFRAGSSQQGNARRASIAWNWVTAIHLSMKNQERVKRALKKIKALFSRNQRACMIRCMNVQEEYVRIEVGGVL